MSETPLLVRVHDGPSPARASIARRLAPIAIAFGALGAACSSQSVRVPDLENRGSEAPRQSAWSCWTEAGDAVGTPPVPGRDDRLRSDGSREVASRLPAMRACVQEAQRALPRRVAYGVSFPSGEEQAVACVGGPSPVPSGAARCLGRALAGVPRPNVAGRRVTAIEGAFDPQSLPEPRAPAPRRARAPLAERCVGASAPAASSSAPVSPPPAAPSGQAMTGPSGARVGGQGTITGGKISSADRVLARARSAVRACYQTSLNRDPGLEGRLLFRMSIDGTGAVAGVCTEGDGLEDGMRQCIHSVLASLVFGAPEGGSATVTGSFSFVNANLDPVASWPWPAIAHAVPR